MTARLAPRTTLWIALATSIIVLPLTVSTNEEPWRLKENHVSTVDVYLEVIDGAGIAADFGRGLVVVPMDHHLSLDYFVEAAGSVLPSAALRPTWIGDSPRLGDLLTEEFEKPTTEAALIITRHNPEAHVFPRIPDTLQAIPIQRYATLVIPAID